LLVRFACAAMVVLLLFLKSGLSPQNILDV